jgi:hypothetical protein
MACPRGRLERLFTRAPIGAWRLTDLPRTMRLMIRGGARTRHTGIPWQPQIRNASN